MSDNVKVAVRVRPFNQREKTAKSTCVIKMDKNVTTIMNPETKEEKIFAFDYSYWSHDEEDTHFANQKTVFDDLGVGVLENAWSGYNTSLFAYGQTGSGKSYSMVGYGKDKGIIPCVCEELFHRITQAQTAAEGQTQFKVETSMMEIYNERVRDLFNPHNTKNDSGLKVRENPKTGPYVDGLALLPVRDYAHIDHLMEEGTKARTVASTQMNATSSRAHTIFTIILTQTTTNQATMKVMDKVSKVNLVDLAGSERANSTGAQGDRLKEGAAINKSLSALGNCISALADAAGGKGGGKGKPYIPYRDSSLTWLLKESLGGNAKTIMIAALSPADINYEETLSTLRYADRAKQIKNVAVVNEDANEKLIRELKEEVERLRALATGQAAPNSDIENLTAQARKEAEEQAAKEMLAYKEQLAESQKLIEQLNKSWEQKIKEADDVENQRKKMLEDMGLAMTEEQLKFPQLININEDRMKSGSIIYALRPGITTVGRPDAGEPQTIKLIGLNMSKEHCVMVSDGSSPARVALRRVGNARTWLNGKLVEDDEVVLKQNDRVLFGNNHLFRFNDPIMSANRMARRESKRIRKQERQQKREKKSRRKKPIIEGDAEDEDADDTVDLNSEEEEEEEEEDGNGDETANGSEEGAEGDWFGSAGVRDPGGDEIDWEFAQRELAMAAGQSELVMNAEKEMAEAEEMRKKMMELEAQLQKDREEAQQKLQEQEEALKKKDEQVQQLVGKEREEAQKEFERQQEEMRRYQQELEEKLKAQEDEAGRMRTEQGIKRRENQIMNDRIVAMLPLVTEANMISEELDRGFRFELKIVPKHILSGDTVNPMVRRGSISFSRDSALAVRVLDTRSDASQIWTREKFMDRIYAIRDYYHRMVVGDDDDEEPMADPFFDEQDVHMVGTSLVYLDSLYYLFDVDMTTPIIDYKGKPEGELRVKMSLVADEKDNALKMKDGSFPDSIEPLKGGTALFKTEIVTGRGLPKRMNKFFVRFQVAERYPMLQTPVAVAMDFHSTHYQEVHIDAQFEQQLLSEALAFQVWGSIVEAPPEQQMRPMTKGGKALKQLDAKNRELDEKAERLAQLEEAIMRRQSAATSGPDVGMRMEVEEEEVLDDDEDLLLGEADVDAMPLLPQLPQRRASTEAQVEGWGAAALAALTKGEEGEEGEEAQDSGRVSARSKVSPRRLSQAMEEPFAGSQDGASRHPSAEKAVEARRPSASSWVEDEKEKGNEAKVEVEGPGHRQEEAGEGAEGAGRAAAHDKALEEREREREREMAEAKEAVRRGEEEAAKLREKEREAREAAKRLEEEREAARRLADERDKQRQAAEEEAKGLREAAEAARKAKEELEAQAKQIEKEREEMRARLKEEEEKIKAEEEHHRKEREEAAEAAKKEREALQQQLQKEQEYKKKVEEDMQELARIKEEMAVLKQQQAKKSKACVVM